MKRYSKTVLITGATATGKSALALALARERGVGILSADSMQVYRHLDIASAKPTLEERRMVPHAGIDLVDPTENFSVAQWLAAVECAFKASEWGWLVAGGSGLYVQAFLHGLDDLPPSPPDLRKKWELAGLARAVKELWRRAPELAAVVDLRNPRRVVRALVLLEMGVRPPHRSFASRCRDVVHIHLERKPEDLRGRIEARTRRMFEEGIVEEFNALVGMGLKSHHSAWQAIGMDSLQALCEGRLSQREAIDAIARRTWQFSRRQRTWFRKISGMHVLEVGESWDEEDIFFAATEVLKREESQGPISSG